MTTIVLDNPKLEQDIPLAVLHPDPVQPRTHPDTDLSASIKTQGILQAITAEPITVDSIPDTDCEECGRSFHELAAEGEHFLILEGERRYRGTIAAGRNTILGKVVPPSTEGARLLRQLTSNAHKALSPVEEAFAFQRLLEAQGWSQAELARQLGRPRSVVGDRIRLVELDAAWLDLISLGQLQVSHAAQLHVYSAIPSKYQAEAAKKLTEDWLDNHNITGDPITIEDFGFALKDAFRPLLTPIGEVSPQYKGPTVEVSLDYQGKRKFAADPEIWKPIAADKAKRARAEQKNSPAKSSPSSSHRYESAMTKALKALASAGVDVPVRKSSGQMDATLKDGETEVFGHTWEPGIHPRTLLDHLDASTLIRVQGSYGDGKLVTTDTVAVTAAREAYRRVAADVSKKGLAPFKEKLTDRMIEAYRITGPGVKQLLRYLDPDDGDERIVALALGIELDADMRSQAEAERLLSALAACQANEWKIPDHWSIDQTIRAALGEPAFKVDKSKITAAPAAAEPKSKKQQKREARAAGKQVGDPKRAHDDNLHGILDDPEREFAEADLEFEEEEELVDA